MPSCRNRQCIFSVMGRMSKMVEKNPRRRGVWGYARSSGIFLDHFGHTPYIRPFVWDFSRPFLTYALHTPLRLGFFSTILDIRPTYAPSSGIFSRPFWTYALHTPLRLGFFSTVLDIRPTYAPSSGIFLDHFGHTPYVRPFVWDFFPLFLTYTPLKFQWTIIFMK